MEDADQASCLHGKVKTSPHLSSTAPSETTYWQWMIFRWLSEAPVESPTLFLMHCMIEADRSETKEKSREKNRENIISTTEKEYPGQQREWVCSLRPTLIFFRFLSSKLTKYRPAGLGAKHDRPFILIVSCGVIESERICSRALLESNYYEIFTKKRQKEQKEAKMKKTCLQKVMCRVMFAVAR